MNRNSKLSILSLLESPCEPVFIPKGRDNVCFDVPPEHLVLHKVFFDSVAIFLIHGSIFGDDGPLRGFDIIFPSRGRRGSKLFATEIAERYADDTATRIRIRDIPLPDLSVPLGLERDKQFSIFFPEHRKMAASLINTFLNLRTFDELLAVAACSRDHLNQQMFFYALSVAILHRNDTKNLPIPALFQVFPACFFNSGVFPRLKEQASIVSESSRIPIEIHKNYTATDLEPENRLAYFREDIGVNSHHWHWHLVYPHSSENIDIVDKDRRGELFYFMHQQILGRYNIARLCAKLGRVKQIKSLRDPEAEAYFPKLNAPEASGTWASRPKGVTVFQDINRAVDGAFYKLEEVERWKERIYLAIHKGEVTTAEGKIIKLTVENNGIDILGNIVEASDLSPNRQLYGDLHNAGQAMISSCHDPDGRHLEPRGVMGSVATAMRDPIFYRWHDLINDIFIEYKKTLPDYTDSELIFPGIEITSSRLTTPDVAENVLMTFWSKSVVNITNGLDFAPKEDILARISHLNHANFKYQLTVLNNSSQTRTGTVRIFMGPKYDERELQFPLREQMPLMIEMDKFIVALERGNNIIERISTESSVTIAFDKVYRDLISWEAIEKATTSESGRKSAFEFCDCGWPHYMLLPKGTEGGYAMQMFVMISNHADDHVEQSSPSSGCRDAVAYCGLRDQKYPDARPMGFPFDRKPPKGVDTLLDFVKPNMSVTDVTVKFTNAVIPRSPATA